MKKIILGSLSVLFSVAIAMAQATAAGNAVMKGTAPDSTIAGVVTLTETPEGLNVKAQFTNVPAPGEHGFHIHENGSCDDMGKAAGGHFNPDKVDHGLLPKDGHQHAHAGDMGNIVVKEDGTANLTVTLADVGLVNGKYNIGGLAVILHEKKDDSANPPEMPADVLLAGSLKSKNNQLNMFLPEDSLLVVIDVQGNLAESMHNKEDLFKNLQGLIRIAKILNVPILCTEQAPEKLGATNASLLRLLENVRPIPKRTFSCYANADFRRELKKLKRKNIVVCGIESHVCVYQTAAELLDAKYNVQIVADAVSSRTLQNRWAGLDRMRSLGAELTSTEMIATEWMRSADHPKFKEILKLIK